MDHFFFSTQRCPFACGSRAERGDLCAVRDEERDRDSEASWWVAEAVAWSVCTRQRWIGFVEHFFHRNVLRVPRDSRGSSRGRDSSRPRKVTRRTSELTRSTRSDRVGDSFVTSFAAGCDRREGAATTP